MNNKVGPVPVCNSSSNAGNLSLLILNLLDVLVQSGIVTAEVEERIIIISEIWLVSSHIQLLDADLVKGKCRAERGVGMLTTLPYFPRRACFLP